MARSLSDTRQTVSKKCAPFLGIMAETQTYSGKESPSMAQHGGSKMGPVLRAFLSQILFPRVRDPEEWRQYPLSSLDCMLVPLMGQTQEEINHQGRQVMETVEFQSPKELSRESKEIWVDGIVGPNLWDQITQNP